MLIDITMGEVLDRISILEIKTERIKDEDKLEHIKHELFVLNDSFREEMKKYPETFIFPEFLYGELKKVNEKLWDLEDLLREKEKNKCYDEEFIKAAEGDSTLNDERFVIKNALNICFNEVVREQKGYKHLDYTV